MKRYLKLLMLILTASFFVLACQDTSDSSNGTNSGIEDGGSGGDGGNGDGDGDGGGSSLDSEIINATMRVSADENDALKNTFFSPAVATNGGKLQYTWNFGDDTESIDTDYNYVTHQFNKYGKTYTVKLLLNNMSSSQQETVTMDLSLPKPELSINCNTSGALIFCNPVISQQAIQDVSYTWNIFNSDGTLEKEILSTGSQIINHRVADSGTYKIVLKGTSTQVDGEMTAEREIYVSVNINQGQITYSNTSSDMLSYKYTFNAQAVDGSQLEYCWDFDGTARCDEGVGFQLGAQYSIADHTYSKYNAANTVTAFARIPGTNEVVSNSVIVQQALPTVSINAEGTGLVRKLSPVFSFRPKGNISYIWKTGDGKEYSQETVNHTYIKNGTYTAELTVLNDLFAPEIGAVSAKPLNIYAYGNIQNVVIEHNRVSQSIEGETYTFSSPATSDTGKLYFTWKVNNAVVAEGENLSSISHIFTKFGQTASVSLELKLAGSNEIVSAEPVLVQASKPTAVLNPPANVTVNVPVEFKGEVLSHLDGTDFTSNLVNPQYKLEISDTEYKYSDTLTIPYTFITRGAYSPKLVVTADNVEGEIRSQPVYVQAAELGVVCSLSQDAVNIYSANVVCKMENNSDNSLKYKLTYQEYPDGVYTTKEYNASETAEFKMYNLTYIYAYDLLVEKTRNIVVNWEIYRNDGITSYSGVYQDKFTTVEPAMGKIAKLTELFGETCSSIIFDVTQFKEICLTGSYASTKASNIFALSENGYVYTWGDGPVTPEILGAIDGKVVDIEESLDKTIFKTENGSVYGYLRSRMGLRLDNITNDDIYVTPSMYTISRSGDLYQHTYYGGLSKINIGKIKKYTNKVYEYFLTENNELYQKNSDTNEISKIKTDIQDIITVPSYSMYGQYIDYIFEKTDGKILMNLSKTKGIDGVPVSVTNNYFVGADKKIYYYGDSITCSGLDSSITQEMHTANDNISALNIPENIKYLSELSNGYMSIYTAFAESGAVYQWSCGTPNKISNINMQGNAVNNYGHVVLFDSGKIFDAESNTIIESPANDKFVQLLAGMTTGGCALTEKGYLYAIKDHKAVKIENVSNVKEIVSVSEQDGKSSIFIITKDGALYALGDNRNNILGIGDITATETYKAVKVEGINSPVKYINVIEESQNTAVLAYTEDNKIYGWGSNMGYLPVGDLYPRTKPVQIDVPVFQPKVYSAVNNKIFVGQNNYGSDTNYFEAVLTEDGDVYSWGYVYKTGTNSKENVSPFGYLMKPTKVN